MTTNIDRAVEVIAEARRSAPRIRDTEDHISPHVAQALADAGLLAPDPIAPTANCDGDISWDHFVGVHHSVGLYRCEDGVCEGTEPVYLRHEAACLLSAANYAEEHDNDQ